MSIEGARRHVEGEDTNAKDDFTAENIINVKTSTENTFVMHRAPTKPREDQTTNNDGNRRAREETSGLFGDAIITESKLEDQNLHLTIIAEHTSMDGR
jgi:hypothetical protein